MARLVVESYNQGAGGAVYIVARTASFGFYRHMGFAPVRRTTSDHFLRSSEGDIVFSEGMR